jgi:xanthine dehydrogenase accessory factor
MVDRRRIVRQWRQGNSKALVTLVRAEGSSYRRPGAHLLIGADGECTGTISGGCLESEVVRKAAWMVRGGALVERYSTLFDDTAEIPSVLAAAAWSICCLSLRAHRNSTLRSRPWKPRSAEQR